jgi:hypothetical protein
LHSAANHRDDVVGLGQGGGDDVNARDPGRGDRQDVEEGREVVGDLGDLPAPFGEEFPDVFPPVLVVDAVGLGVVQGFGAFLGGGLEVVVGLVGLRGEGG